MTHLQKLRLPSLLKRVSVNISLKSQESNVLSNESYDITGRSRLYRRKRNTSIDSALKVSRATKEAQTALIEYLHCTRSFPFTDAEYISRHSPLFLQELLKRVNIEQGIRRSITRFLRYNPINEFEPFFESMGLSPYEYSSFLPRDLMYLDDNQTLLQNYTVLCNYGFPRGMLGRIYKEAADVFRYGNGLLQSKLQTLEEMGINKDIIVNIVCSSPYLLTGDQDRYFLKMFDKLKSIKLEDDWISKHLIKNVVYRWNQLFELLNLLSSIIGSDEQLRILICQHPTLLFASGNTSYSLITFFLKFGWTRKDFLSFFLLFPQIQLAKFVSNLKRSHRFLVEIDMDAQGIGKLICTNPLLLGSCNLKRASSVLGSLQTGKKRICDIIKENPLILKDWELGLRVQPLPSLNENSYMMKTKFLRDLGFVKDSNEIRKALKRFRGSGMKLQERFDCLVKTGISREDVLKMIKIAPQILNQSKDVIEIKIDFLVNGMGYPLSSLVSFPAYISYNVQRVKLRLSMYSWLRCQGLVEPNLSLCTIIAITDELFIRRYVDKNSQGPEIWKKLKEQFCPS
ncbi:transcription termination factor MTEF18, mitochondrial-like [Impatiens glandulifera]|uniref:transcription termination factor MTEF18, mitochondrial-like n=1 Tax=Impatiens glandulifera TaxID=253017 RepID=UPI001FB07D74|nr:transcription termination factor MTEF18, mitochondrial-like [Impatiens glandulifera]